MCPNFSQYHIGTYSHQESQIIRYSSLDSSYFFILYANTVSSQPLLYKLESCLLWYSLYTSFFTLNPCLSVQEIHSYLLFWNLSCYAFPWKYLNVNNTIFYNVNSEGVGYMIKFLLWEAPTPYSARTIACSQLSCNFISLQMCREFILRWKSSEFQVKVEASHLINKIVHHCRTPHQAGKSASEMRVDLWMLITNIGLENKIKIKTCVASYPKADFYFSIHPLLFPFCFTLVIIKQMSIDAFLWHLLRNISLCSYFIATMVI